VKNLLSILISLAITLIFLDIIKLSFIPGFIVGSILWSVLHYKISKILKD